MSVEQRATLGGDVGGALPIRANGQFLVVRLKVRFDETTISPQRPRDATLTANPHKIQLITKAKHWVEWSETGQQALAASGLPGSGLKPKPLVPGEATEIAVAFDVPTGEQPWLLLMTQDDPAERWMIGSENSWLHGRSAWRVD